MNKFCLGLIVLFAGGPVYIRGIPIGLNVKTYAKKVCCLLFGNEDISDNEIIKFVKEAREKFELSTNKGSLPPLKYIRPGWLAKHFSSFTWFGTWINKEAWEKMNDNEKTFCIYHEIAHEKKRHPIIQSGIFLFNVLVACYCTPKIISVVFKKGCLQGKFVGVGLIAVHVVEPILVSWRSEKAADITAAEMLCQNDKKNVVEEYVENLESLISERDDRSFFAKLWFFSAKNRIAYLNNVLEQNNS